MNPDISVIVLTYNQEATIARALDSILAQDCGPLSLEIVISDDGSADSTRAICETYAHRYPSLIRLLPAAPNKGVVANYFDTLAQCRGRFIADCSGDDFRADSKSLLRQADILDSEPDITIAYSDWAEVDPAGNPLRLVRPLGLVDKVVTGPGLRLLEPLLAHRRPMPIHLSAALYRAATARAALAEATEMVCNRDFGCEDLPLLAALLYRGRAAYVPGVALNYTVGTPTVSNPASLERTMRFYEATVRCTAALAEFYGIRSRGIEKYFKARLIYLAKLARHVGTRRAKENVGELAATIGRRLPLMARAIMWL